MRRSPPTRPVRPLGQLLLELGWISERDLARALPSQEAHGGRLGTCLLEVDAINERLLNEALAYQLGIDSVRPIDLQNIPDRVLEALSGKIASRCRAVPYRLLGRELWVALLDVHHLSNLDEIAFATGLTIHPRVANELRIEVALERFYDQPTSSRYKVLWRRLHDEDPTAEILHASMARRPAPLPLGETANRAPEPSTPPSRITQPIPPAAAEQPELAPVLLHPASDRSLAAALSARLRSATTRRDIAQTLVDGLLERHRRVVLVSRREGGWYGWHGGGRGFEQGRFGELRIDEHEPSVFLNIACGAPFQVGPLAPMQAHLRLLGCFHAPLPASALVMPVRLRERLVAAIFCEPHSAPRPEDIEILHDIARATAEALAAVIVRDKSQRNTG